jgi:hypothetical protein
MREDMFKVIVERPRHGRGWSKGSRRRLAGDGDLPVKIGVKRYVTLTKIRSKSLNENLQPLKRYLGQQLGRPWNDVYSEISATLSPGHIVKAHVRQHLDDYVARNVMRDRDGKWIGPSRRNFGLRELPWRQDYYVDPDNGLLKDSRLLWKKLKLDPKPWRRKKPEPDPDVRVLDKMRELRRIEGIWYEVIYNRNQDCNSEELIFDLITRELVPIGRRHAVAKRQLSTLELKSFGVSNN